MRRFDDPAGEEQGVTKQGLDLGRFDAVLGVFGLVAVVPIELLAVACETIQPRYGLGIVLEAHSS